MYTNDMMLCQDPHIVSRSEYYQLVLGESADWVGLLVAMVTECPTVATILTEVTSLHSTPSTTTEGIV